MPKYNVAVPVVEVLEAPSEDGAIAVLKLALEQAGFNTYEGELPTGAHAFESEPDAEVSYG